MDSDEKKKKIAATLFNTGGNSVKSNNLAYALNSYVQCTKLVPEMLIYRQSARGTARKLYKDNGKGASGAGLRSGGTWMSIKLAKSRKKWLDVMELAEDILALNPWDVDAMLEICNACKEIGTLAETGHWVAQNATQVNKERKDAWLVYSDFCIERKLFNEAIRALEVAKKLDPNDAALSTRIRELAAQSTIHGGGYEGEESEEGEGEEGAEKAPPKPSPVIKQAAPPPETPEERALRELGEFEAKVAAEPTNPQAYIQLGNAYRRANDIPKALDAYNRGSKACNNDGDLRMLFLELRIEQLRANIVEAQTYVSKLDKNMPDYPDKSGKANAHVKAAEAAILKAEIELFKLRLQYSPDDHSTALELGKRLYEAKDVDEAIKYLQRARNDMRQKWKALMYLGLCFREKKNYTLADKNLGDALPMVPALDEKGKKEVFYWRGVVAQEGNNKEFAVECFNEVAAIDYAYRDVAQRLDQLTGGAVD